MSSLAERVDSVAAVKATLTLRRRECRYDAFEISSYGVFACLCSFSSSSNVPAKAIPMLVAATRVIPVTFGWNKPCCKYRIVE